jgi:enoyl-CoA hydratase/carnithine racemase
MLTSGRASSHFGRRGRAAFAGQMAQEAPLPMAYTKQWFADELERALAREADFQAALFVTEDSQEGRAAFLAKRKPVFQGR